MQYINILYYNFLIAIEIIGLIIIRDKFYNTIKSEVDIMVVFKVKQLLDKNKMSRYKFRQYSNFSYERVNDYYFSRVKSIKVEELDIMCKIFKCKIGDIIEFKG